jgi:hypothetical protein
MLWVYILAQKNSSLFDTGIIYMLHKSGCTISWILNYNSQVSKDPVHFDVICVSNFFLSLFVPQVKETLSLRFFIDGLLFPTI